MYDNRVEVDTNEYYSNLKEGTKVQDYLATAADTCLTLMDLLDNSQFLVTEKEARDIRNQLRELVVEIINKVKDE